MHGPEWLAHIMNSFVLVFSVVLCAASVSVGRISVLLWVTLQRAGVHCPSHPWWIEGHVCCAAVSEPVLALELLSKEGPGYSLSHLSLFPSSPPVDSDPYPQCPLASAGQEGTRPSPRPRVHFLVFSSLCGGSRTPTPHPHPPRAVSLEEISV